MRPQAFRNLTRNIKIRIMRGWAYVWIIFILIFWNWNGLAQPITTSIQCRDDKQVLDFLQQLSKDFPQPNQQSDFKKRLQSFDEFWKKCASKMTQRSKDCFENMRKFALSYKNSGKSGHQLGWEVSDIQHYANAKKSNDSVLSVPALVLHNGQISTGLADHIRSCNNDSQKSTTEKCQRVKGWAFVEFENYCSLPGVARNKLAVLFMPGTSVDNWVVLSELDYGPQGKGWSAKFPMQSVIKKGPDGKALPQPEIVFAQMENGHASQSTRCISCHSNGPLVINPLPGSVDKEGQDSVEKLNTVIKKYGQFNYAKLVKLQHRGPALGSSIGCTKCHSFDEYSAANRQPIQIESLQFAQSSIKNFTMPYEFRLAHAWTEALKKVAELSPETRAKVRAILTQDGKCAFENGVPSFEARKAVLDLLRSEKSMEGKVLLSNSEYKLALTSLEESNRNATEMSQELAESANKTTERWLTGDSQLCSPNQSKASSQMQQSEAAKSAR